MRMRLFRDLQLHRWGNPTLTLAVAVLWLVLGMAGPVSAQSEETFQDWKRVCNEKGICNAQHTAASNLAQIVIGPSPDGKRLNMAFLIAKEAKQDAPAGLLIKTKGILPLKVRECGPQFCFAVPPNQVVSQAIEDLKAEREAVIAYQTENQMVIATISLMGMSSATEGLAP
jgi:invasion protein IalB